MFARNVTMRLKPGRAEDFNRTLENEVMPLLKRQKGFKDEISFIVTGETQAIGISLWDNKSNAEAYDRDQYPKVIKALSEVSDGTPTVTTCEVTYSTLHNITTATKR